MIDIPRKLTREMLNANTELLHLVGKLEVFLNGEQVDFLDAYDMDRGYVDCIQMRYHYHGCNMYKTFMNLNNRTLVNRVFGEVTVRIEE
jgi:hypothetical protein